MAQRSLKGMTEVFVEASKGPKHLTPRSSKENAALAEGLKPEA